MNGYGGIFGGGMRRSPWEITEDGSRMAVEAPQAGPQKQGGGFKHVIGILGDALLGAAGKEGFYGPLLAHRKSRDQDFARQQQLMQQQRAAGIEDFQRKRQFEIANPAPDAFDRALAGAGIDPNSPQGRQLFADRAASMSADPNDQFVSVNIPGLGTYAGPKSGLANFVGGGTPTAPVGKLTPIGGGDGVQQSAPQMVISPMELDALVQRYGPQEVQRRIDSGVVVVRNN